MWGRAIKFGCILLKKMSSRTGTKERYQISMEWNHGDWDEPDLMSGMRDWAEGSSSYFLPMWAHEQLGKTGSTCQPVLLAGDTMKNSSLLTTMGSESGGDIST